MTVCNYVYEKDFLYCKSEILKQTSIKEDKRIDRNNPDDLIMLHNELDNYDNENDTITEQDYDSHSSFEFEDAEYILPMYIPHKSEFTFKTFFTLIDANFIEYSLQLHIYFKHVEPESYSYWKKYFQNINELWKKDFSKIVKNKLKQEKLIILHF